ncbi:hypothetical protein MMUR_22170 [Mycolicibacterium murale]|uniref:PhiRv1 phage protein n=1 Tax=Mycolicibacterium murale TaxID=182220 RepID=A0A7I9WK06_9MYCO|nr:hypothetical protein [Mycolicibacterium murale]MCV7185582.1 hypothetical protein [Mycolicibacterium murale]GFG58081.1 hypothetical protein MMUR_22170 [Mycolicibacterium murale]
MGNASESRHAEYVRAVVAAAPPLREDQRVKLAELLRPVRTSSQTATAS